MPTPPVYTFELTDLLGRSAGDAPCGLVCRVSPNGVEVALHQHGATIRAVMLSGRYAMALARFLSDTLLGLNPEEDGPPV